MIVEQSKQIIAEVNKAFIGKNEIVEKVLMTIYAGGHVLLEDCPGVGKTTLALAFSKALGLSSKRIQFTTDTLPSDITGFTMFNRETNKFEYHEGSANCQLLLADEINRTSPKTQSALLEVMEEHTITVDGVTHRLPQPFLCIATQNPVGAAGTQPLPESQLDRFMVSLSIGYPTLENQIRIINAQRYQNPLDEIRPVTTAQNIMEVQNYLTSVRMTDPVLAYAIRLCEATRTNPLVELGISPRGILALVKMSRAHAILKERNYVIPEDVQAVFLDVCAHRLVLRPQARVDGVTARTLLEEILATVRPPEQGQRGKPMWENRICYLLFGLVVAVLLFQFSQPFLLCLLICLVVLALFMAIALRREAANLTVSLRTSPGGQVGKQLYASVTATAGHRLLAARSVLMEVELANITTGYTKRQRFLLPLSGRKSTFNLPLDVEQCGRTVLKCSAIVVRDQFNLFCAPTAPFGEVYTVIYPSSVDVDVTLSRASTRAPRGDGLMQNRKGGDPSEMYDIREYQPGDDIRAIHWKLSSKTDALILRQASDPAHFNVAIMPDFGRNVDGKPADPKTLNAAIAYGSALGSELVRQGVPFCMAIPNGSGLDLYEVRTPREHEQMLARWLSTPVQENSGDGLKYFLMEHLDAQFTRLMILAADGYSMDLNRVDGRITATVLNAVLGAGGTHAVMNSSCDFMELPVEPSDRDNCRILC